jgi:hypothetical protein
MWPISPAMPHMVNDFSMMGFVLKNGGKAAANNRRHRRSRQMSCKT